jgi:EmrB/QacA subfamily drug resistance transporter
LGRVEIVESSAARERSSSSIILLVLAIAGVSYALLQAAVAPAIPNLQTELDVSLSGASWVLTAILLSASVATPVVGRLGDLYGRQRVLVAVLLVFAFGTVICALASSLPLMLSGRVLQGVGGGIFPLAFGIVRDVFPREKIAGAIGILSATLGIGGGFGIVVSGLILKYLNFHYLFWIPLFPILFAALAAWKFIPESSERRQGTINWLGAILLGIGLTALLLGVTQGRTWGWGSSRTIGIFVLAVVALVAWVFAELRAREPLVNMKIMVIRGVWTANAVALLVGLAMFGSFTVVAQYMQIPESTGYGFGKNVLIAGLFLLPSSTMMLVSGFFAGPMEKRFGARPIIVTGAVLSVMGFVLMALFHSQEWHFLVSGTVLGLGNGLCFASLAGVVVLAVPQDQVGAATGMNTVVRTIGQSLGTAVPGTILASRTIDGSTFPTESAFALVFWLIAGAMVLAIVAATLMPRRAKPASGAGVVMPATSQEPGVLTGARS